MANDDVDLNPTTVRLTEKARKIKDELGTVFGLKNILSAGLVVFSQMSEKDQKLAIQEANGVEGVSVSVGEALRLHAELANMLSCPHIPEVELQKFWGQYEKLRLMLEELWKKDAVRDFRDVPVHVRKLVAEATERAAEQRQKTRQSESAGTD